MDPNIFLTYNPDADFEEALALQLLSMEAMSHCVFSLPDRDGEAAITDGTRQRIRQSDFVVYISTVAPQAIAIEEVRYAVNLNKKVLVLDAGMTERGNHAVRDWLRQQVKNRHSLAFATHDPESGSPQSVLQIIFKHLPWLPVT